MKLIIEGGKRLEGTTKVQSAKNSVLPLLAASILTSDKVTIEDCPNILDVKNMLKILSRLGMKVSGVSSVTVEGELSINEVPKDLAGELRSSIFLLGAILSVKKKAKIAYPGGCDIGLRPIDIHINGLKALNVKINESFGFVECDATDMKANDILLDLPSVGATENLIMASVFLRGKTTLRNVAKEPEIVDLSNMLNLMGAKISGAGTSVIEIVGVDSLRGVIYKPIPDRIVAGTLLFATATCGGEIELTNVIAEHVFPLTAKLLQNSCKLDCKYDKIRLMSNGRLNAVDLIETSPYPGFPTDMQAQVMASLLTARGTSVVVENLFETRFKHVPEYNKMGADVTVRGNTAIVRGVQRLSGAEVVAKDLRGGAGLVIAGLKAEGVTTVLDVRHIDRGYDGIEKVLQKLGATIRRISYE